jgi:hypothetical protein
MHKLWLLLLWSILLTGCMDDGGSSSANTPEEMFAAVIADPIPTEVTALQGVGDTWQGYQLFLRFTAPEAIRNALFASYEETPCEDLLLRLALPDPAYDQFTPSWTPQTVIDPACYTAEVSNAWTYGGSHIILVDAATNQVYFQGIGG